MKITRATLEEHAEKVRAQIAAYTGVLQFIEALYEHLDAPDSESEERDSLTEQELAELVAGPGAKVDGKFPAQNRTTT